MEEERLRRGPDQPQVGRYYAQHVNLPGGSGGSSQAALQEAIDEGAGRGWKLIGLAQDPTTQGNFLGVLLVWETGGF